MRQEVGFVAASGINFRFGSKADSNDPPLLGPLSGVKRTSISGDWMSACSHKRTSVQHYWCGTGCYGFSSACLVCCVYVTFHLAEVAVPRDLLREILKRIEDLRKIDAFPNFWQGFISTRKLEIKFLLGRRYSQHLAASQKLVNILAISQTYH